MMTEDQGAQVEAQARAAAQSARDAAEQARDIARAQREAAQAQRDAAQAQRDAESASDGVGPVTITTPDGKTITLVNPTRETMEELGLAQTEPRGDPDGPYIMGALGIISSAIVLIVGLVLWYRARTRGGGKAATLPPDLNGRLQRMEAGIESVAVEVERISEGQRFTTRLLADRAAEEVRRG
ncbi:MAG TPA: hypothetical protein VE861_02430 [Gemmatimonadaceae bacterium]|nr:hypothetical protein [Gemmatimonadaceae bacterium]